MTTANHQGLRAPATTLEPFAVAGHDGGVVRGVVHRRPEPSPVVVLTAGLGMPMRRMLLPALFMTANGFTVVRFDPRNSVGVSDGDIADFTLTGLAADLVDVADWATGHLGVDRVAMFTASLTGRASLRAAATRPDLLSIAATVACVVSVERTLARVKGEDLVARWRAGELDDPEALDDLLDYRIKLKAVRSIIDEDWADLDSTRRDVRRATGVEFLNLYGDRDPWVFEEETQEVFGTAGNSTLIVLRDAVHELNFATAKTAMQQLVAHFSARLLNAPVSPEDVVVPSFDDFTECNKADRLITAGLPSLSPTTDLLHETRTGS
jgi:pimeloyl-ACP methyl ester carboxylesterase